MNPPVLPMLAKRVDELPAEGKWIFEPKWDGFRALVFRDGDELEIQSRDEKPLNRYFPEIVEALESQLPPRAVLDGEIVIARGSVLDFEALQLRLHPAASRVKTLAKQTPASIVFFDLLSGGERDLRNEPFELRRTMLEDILRNAAPPVYITPATQERATALDWFRRFEGAGLDGVMAKPASGNYEPDKRVMLKVKHERECDCVVAGFRWYKGAENEAVGSLLLGLYDKAGMLQHVGVCASFTAEKRRELLHVSGAISHERTGQSPVEGVGWPSDGRRRNGRPCAGGTEPLEPRQGSFLGAAESGAGGGSGVRAHAGFAFPPHGAFPQVANR